MDLNKLKIFYYAAKAGSFTNNDLHLSSSVISRHISDLEYRHKTKLFYRYPRKLVLTPEGQILYASACKIMQEVEHAQSLINNCDINSQPKGLLTLFLPTVWTNMLFAQHATRFMKIYPNIRLNILNDESSPELQLKDYQIAILPYMPVDTGFLMIEKIATYDLNLYASLDYIFHHGLPTCIEDLDHHRLLAYAEGERYIANINWHLKAGCNTFEERIPYLRTCDLYQAVHQGIGIAPLIQGKLSPNFGQLKPILPQIESTKIDVFIAFPEYMQHCPIIKLFHDFMMSAVQKGFNQRKLVH